MDPLSALISVATAVTQFIDFTSKLLSISYEIYHSAEGRSSDNIKTKEVCEKLARTSHKLATADADPILQELASTCKSHCDDILRIVRTTSTTNRNTKLWASVKTAVKEMLGKKKLAELERDLENARNLLSLELQSVLQQQITEHGSALRALKEDSRKLGLQQSVQLDIIARGVMDLKRSLESTPAASEASWQIPSAQWIEWLKGNIGEILSAKAQAQKEQAILASLHFPSRPNRHHAIRDAHAKTFGWIYDSKFTEWLKQEHGGVYWITGKAGSGKSTLMKFIADNVKTKNIFTEAVQPKQAIIASHYFWSGGSEMQKSLRGLLQTLLFEIFKQRPSLMPIVSQHRWENCADQSLQQDWTLPELLTTLRNTGRAEAAQARICIFVDGVDEFGHDHYELCQILKGLVEGPGIKVCVSSRPWNVFDDFFGASSTIAIHHHTKDDIRKFAQDQLETHPRWNSWSLDGGDKNTLVDEITKRSEGVFLWAFLVTRRLRDGITDEDTQSDLRKKLESLPSDLELLFKHMLDGVDALHHEKMAGMLRIAVLAHRPLRWEIYHYHDYEYDSADYAIDRALKETTEIENLRKFHQTRRRLNARTRGLLEINGDPVQDTIKHVDFLHRTVRDFLCTDTMSAYLEGKSSSQFDTALSICKAHLAWIKSTCFVGGKEASPDGEYFDHFINETLKYTQEVSDSSKDDMVRTVDELERSVIASAEKHHALDEKNNRRPREFFRTLVLREDAEVYLSRKLLQSTHYLSALELPGLILALQETPPPMRTLALLLQLGHNPNKSLPDDPYETPWCYLVQEYCGWGQSISSEALDVAIRQGLFTMFLNHGADPNHNALASTGYRFSTFAMFLLAYLRSSWRTVAPESYIVTFKEFVAAGANLSDTVVLPPSTQMAVLSLSRWPEPEFASGVSDGSTIREIFSRQAQRVVSLSLSEENRADVKQVIDVVDAVCD